MALSIQSASLGGRLLLSIDLELDVAQQGAVQTRRLDAVAAALLALCQRRQLAATWAVADPARSAATEMIRAAGESQELAVLGDHTWVGAGAGRQRFARELARRFDTARSEGIAARTLVLRNVPLGDHLDVVARHEVTAVRPPIRGRSVPTSGGPELLHYGVWGFAPTAIVPGTVRWWPGSGGELNAVERVAHGAARGSVVHLAIDAPRIVDQGEPALELVERVLERAADCCDAGFLRSTTLGDLAGHLLERRTASGQRSILRSA